MPSCTRCGTQDPQRMHGLMCLWFGPLADVEGDLGYFHLCPSCHDELIAPEMERIQNRILELHPAAHRHLEHEWAEEEQEQEQEEEQEQEAEGAGPEEGRAEEEAPPKEDEASS